MDRPAAGAAASGALRHRVQLVRLRTLLRNRIHAVLAGHGHDRPGGYGSGPGRAWLASLALPAASRELIEDDRALTGALEHIIDRLDGEVHQRARSDSRVKVLTQLPGVGPLTALVILAEVGDVSRFGSARKLASWAGLTPTVRDSDRTVTPGTSRAEPGPAAVGAVRGGADRQAAPAVRRQLPGHRQRRGKKIPTTAVARKLLTRAWHLLTQAECAAAQPAAAAAAQTAAR